MFDAKLNAGRLKGLAAACALLCALASGAAAQSTDPENPTPMTSNVVEGKSNGKAKTVYYAFTATAADGGEVKVKVTANTDERSTNLRVNFLDPDGGQVMDEIYVIPNRDPATKVGRHTFAERQPVVMRVTLPQDPQVKLLSYRIEVTGAVEFEQPAAATTDAGAAADAPAMTPTDQAGPQPSAQTDGGPTTTQQGTKQKIKATAKKSAKKSVKDAVDQLLTSDDDPE